MQTPTQIMLAAELAAQGLSQTKIAAHLERHRETLGLWLNGIATDGLSGFLAPHRQARKDPAVHTFLDRYHDHRPHWGLWPLRPPLQPLAARKDGLSYIYGE